jgi:glycosyltransferase involved in cell wall biosynthesis
LNIKLPDLKAYRSHFQQKGINWPLSTVEYRETGLLNHLPKADNSNIGWPWTEEVDPAVYYKAVNWPKLTIVTPSYNQDKFIEQTIRSVLLQNYPNLEFIIIDGGSTDGSTEIIKKYSPWISYWQSEKDKGQGNAINQGFSLASGTYHAWINSDDYYLNKTFLRVIQEFIKTRASFVYGYAFDYLIDKQRFNNVTKVIPFIDYFIRFPSLVQPSCFWNMEIHQPIWEDLHCSLDYELWLRIVKGNQRSLIKEPLSVANVHMDAKTSDPKMKEKWHQDHLLICGADAHGPVLNWDKLAIINRLRIKLYNCLR